MSGEGVSDLGAHLAEMDKMLRDIQVELAPGREPRPALGSGAGSPPPPKAVTRGEAAPATPDEPTIRSEVAREPVQAEPEPLPPAPPPQPEPPPEPDPQLGALADLAAHLVASMRELLDGYEGVVAQTSPSITRGAAPRSARSRLPREQPGSQVTLSAGPFGSIEALREFELAVSRLRGVRDVTVRGYQGADRAIIEVRLDPLSP